MRSVFVVLLLIALGVCLSAQPAIRSVSGVQNAASEAVQGMPNSAIAEGSIFTVYADTTATGYALGPAVLQEVAAFPIATTLAGTTVNITPAGGKAVPAPMIFTVDHQVAAIMPTSVPVGSATVSVSYGGGTSSEYPIQVVANSFGTFTVNQQGNGTGDVTNGNPGANNEVFLPNRAAIADDVAIIWGTGVGRPQGYNDAAVPVADNLTNIPVKVYVGGQLVPTNYQGPSGCCAGVDQIVFHVPSGITGCAVPVDVLINGIVSPSTTMSIAADASRVCSDEDGISGSVIQTLLSKPSFNLGFVSLTRTTATSPITGTTTTTDTGDAGFFNIQPLQYAGTAYFQEAAIGSCIVLAISESQNPLSGLTGLDAGLFINVNGTGGDQHLTPISGFPGDYASTNTTPFLTPGVYAATGTGGANVGAFSVNMTVANPIVWTNEATVAASPIDRAEGVTVTWNGGASGTYARITGDSLFTGPPAVVAAFTCIAPIAQGAFTVGPDVLLQLPPSGSIDGFGLGFLAIGNAEPFTTFTAIGLDYGYAQSSNSVEQSVTYQ